MGASRRRLKWEPARSTLWLNRASLNSTRHRASPSEEQVLPAVFQAATPSADFYCSRPAIAINSRPVTSRAPPQASHYASGYPRFLRIKMRKTPHKIGDFGVINTRHRNNYGIHAQWIPSHINLFPVAELRNKIYGKIKISKM
jgi:hypothetical protein